MLLLLYHHLLLLLLHFLLGPVACFPSELIWNYGSYRQSVGLLGRVISTAIRPTAIYTGQYGQKKRGQVSMPRVGFEPTIPVIKQARTFYALHRILVATEIIPKVNKQPNCGIVLVNVALKYWASINSCTGLLKNYQLWNKMQISSREV
jgi:hypothetical protein